MTSAVSPAGKTAHNPARQPTKTAHEPVHRPSWKSISTAKPGCCTLIIHGFFIFFHPPSPFGLTVVFPAPIGPPISPLSLPLGLPSRYPSATSSTIELPSPTPPAHRKHLPAMSALNLYEKTLTHDSGLAIRRNKRYTQFFLLGFRRSPVVQKKARSVYFGPFTSTPRSDPIPLGNPPKKKNQIQRRWILHKSQEK